MAETRRIWDNYKVVGEVQKSDSIKLVIAAACRDGVKYINIREFYLRKRDNTWMPSRDGITCPIEIPVNSGKEICKSYEGLVAALDKTVRTLADMPLMDEKNAVYIEKKERTK